MHKKIKAHLLIGGLFLMLASCNSVKKVIAPTPFNYKDYEARWSDIPFLIDFIATDQSETDTYISVTGASSLSIDDIVEFYKHEMERLGWHMSASFSKDWVKLIFEKPSKICLIEVSSNSSNLKRSSVAIYFGVKV
jgi:hypothetical protein